MKMNKKVIRGRAEEIAHCVVSSTLCDYDKARSEMTADAFHDEMADYVEATIKECLPQFVDTTDEAKLISEIIDWLECDTIQGVFVMAAVHGMRSSEEFKKSDGELWEKAREIANRSNP